MPDHDVAIIGAGAAGLSVAAMAASLGLKVALFERERIGGGSLNTGSLPTQALLAAAHKAKAARDLGRYGIRLGDIGIDWAGLRRHMHQAVEAARQQESPDSLERRGIQLIHASAHFIAPDRIEAAGRVHSFRRAVIAAGCAPVVPDLPGLVTCPWLTYDTIHTLETAPSHLLILGGQEHGVALAQAYARLGCRVTLIEASPNILGDEDPELRLPLREALRQDGVEILENTAAIGVERAGDGVALTVIGGARIEGSHLLFALGEAPRLAPLDLAAGGIASTPRGVATRRDLRSTTNRRVWAAGDIADPEGLGPQRFTHMARHQAEIILRSMLLRLPARLDHATLPRVLYTAPEFARIGLSETEARAAGHEPRVIREAFAQNHRAIAEGETEGQVKLVLGAGERLLGAAVLGKGAGDMAGLFGLLIGRRLPATALAELLLPYPTRAEAAKRGAQKLYADRVFSPMLRRVARIMNRLP